jgi:ketosteroid isomerase-like protein
MKTASKCSLFTLLLATLAASSTIHAQQPVKHDPVAIMQAYWDALNSANLPAVMELISDDLAPYTYATCTPQMSAKQCFGTFVETTIIKRHGSLVVPTPPKVEGDVVIAIVEVRHDVTRAAGIPRMLGTSTTTVKNNKITSFKFVQLPDDPHNKRLAAFVAANAAATPAAPAR